MSYSLICSNDFDKLYPSVRYSLQLLWHRFISYLNAVVYNIITDFCLHLNWTRLTGDGITGYFQKRAPFENELAEWTHLWNWSCYGLYIMSLGMTLCMVCWDRWGTIMNGNERAVPMFNSLPYPITVSFLVKNYLLALNVSVTQYIWSWPDTLVC